MKKSISEARQLIGYEFVVFKMAIDDLPASQIKQIADDWKERIAWDLWAGTVSLNVEILNILTFWDFLDSQIIPAGLSPAEQVFYRRTAKRMVREGFLSSSVLQLFTNPKSIRTPIRIDNHLHVAEVGNGIEQRLVQRPDAPGDAEDNGQVEFEEGVLPQHDPDITPAFCDRR